LGSIIFYWSKLKWFIFSPIFLQLKFYFFDSHHIHPSQLSVIYLHHMPYILSTGDHLSGVSKYLKQHCIKKPIVVGVEPLGSIIFGGCQMPYKQNDECCGWGS
jgi:hypothetical protein